MASRCGEPILGNSQAGLEVVPQTLYPPNSGHLIVADESEIDGVLPPLEFLADIAEKVQPKVKLKCAECKAVEQHIRSLVFCRDCNRCFHQCCWIKYEDHTPDTSGGEPCQEYSRLDVHLWMKHLHSPQRDEEALLRQLYQDRPHRWIGIADKVDGERTHDASAPKLLLYAALTKQFTDVELMTAKQFPRLISFFGDTGKGKSTIIQNLIRNITYSKAKHFGTPVVGASTKSTSGGIHVYCDPETFRQERPIVYADCEGFAGDSEPLANRFDNRFKDTHDRQTEIRTRSTATDQWPTLLAMERRDAQSAPLEDHFQSHIPMPISMWGLPWINMENTSSGTSHWTDTVVARIYPRFLYIFSDVVCYISNDPKAAEHDMARLVDWANEARDFTTNQGVKPNLIYIVNQDNHSNFMLWRDSNHATEEMLKKWKSSKRFTDEQKRWRDRGAVIETADQLLRCYYRDVTVVCIPQFLPGRTVCSASDLQRQYNLLYQKIDGQSLNSSEKRGAISLLLDFEAFSRNSIRVLGQLAEDPHCIVDLKELAEPFRKQPTNFISHVLNILRRLRGQSYCPDATTAGTEVRLIKKVLPYLVVCVAGEVLRSQGHGFSEDQIVIYGNRWKDILNHFSMQECRCEEIFQSRRCCNYRDRHSHGHQFTWNHTSGAGRVRAGDFKSEFTASIDALHKNFIQSLMNSNVLRIRTATNWGQELFKNAQTCGIREIVSNRTCLACLSRTPVHIMPCGHSLCDICTLNLSIQLQGDETFLSLKFCAFGCIWPSGKPFQIRRKPVEAGVRTLSLDGGGVRGIVELAVLEAIMNRVGHDLPIQELFDVIAGTSTGGIIALGIFKKKWTIAKATKNFEELVKSAFSTRGFLRPWIELPGLHLCAQLICNSLFKSEGIERALCTAFDGGTLLFGPPTSGEADANKVAVIATCHEKQQPVLLTNYNREVSTKDEERDIMRREEQPDQELKVWEAARCTSAAPTYFEPYKHSETGRVYTDGATEKNNPVHLADDERRFIWPKSSEHNRDIVVSIGTGYSTNYDGMPEKDRKLSDFLQGLQHLGIVRKIIDLKSVLQSSLNCKKMWLAFQSSLGTDEHLLGRCHRINIPYGAGQSLCDLDDWQKMKDTKAEALKVLSGKSTSVSGFVQDQLREEIDFVARQLLASLFYMTVQILNKNNSGDTSICTGRIRCRLGRSYEKQFHSLLRRKPAFRVIDNCGYMHNLVLDVRTWDAAFSIPACFQISEASAVVRVQITLDNGSHWDTISGFPRQLEVHTSRDAFIQHQSRVT